MGRGTRPPRARRRRRPTAPARPAHRSPQPILLLLLLLLVLAPLLLVAAHDTQQPPPASPPCPSTGPEAEPVPQAALETVLREQSEGGEEKKESFYQWFGAKVRENSLSEYLRDRFYDDEVEKLNPTCSVIGFLLRTMPVCPVVRKLEECA